MRVVYRRTFKLRGWHEIEVELDLPEITPQTSRQVASAAVLVLKFEEVVRALAEAEAAASRLALELKRLEGSQSPAVKAAVSSLRKALQKLEEIKLKVATKLESGELPTAEEVAELRAVAEKAEEVIYREVQDY